MLIIVADCEVNYTGRLTTYLPRARRAIIVKADRTVLVMADRGHQPLNWMVLDKRSSLHIEPDRIVATKGKEQLEIMLHQVLARHELELGAEPGLAKAGEELEMQQSLAARPEAILPGLRLIQREYATSIGPIDLLCRTLDDQAVVVEVKRTAAGIEAVEQVCRYVTVLSEDSRFAHAQPVLVAQSFRPQTVQYAQRRGVLCVQITLEQLRQGAEGELRYPAGPYCGPGLFELG
jgi:hypothetical protein